MTHTAADRTRPPLTGDERFLLTAFLDFHRATPRLKCAELDILAGQDDPATPTGQPTPPSTGLPGHRLLPSPLVSPIAVVAHLRWMEQFWCEVVLGGQSVRLAHAADDAQLAYEVPQGSTLEQVLDDYDRQCETSRRILAGLDLDHQVLWHGRPTSVRWVFLRLIEETARHNGHLDALHELISGAPAE